MKITMDVTAEQLEIIQEILKRHLPSDAYVYAFGSRVKMNAKPFSDLDLVIDMGGPVPIKAMALLATDFEYSSLPYKVDIVDWAAIDDPFRGRINQDKVKINLSFR